MAEIEKTEAKAQGKKTENKPVKKDKPSIGARISKFFREYKAELNKVTWASKEDTLRNTVVVAVTVVVVGAVIGVLDVVFTEGLRALGNLI
ncbi:MAG: preprotein translocase subunit SecE [Clostridia bacterium]|nr:preprotein translocase subunit SecE [Clostridia bacterium]